MREEYVLLEYSAESIAPKLIYKSNFIQDVEITKMRKEANNINNNRYSIQVYKTTKLKK